MVITEVLAGAGGLAERIHLFDWPRPRIGGRSPGAVHNTCKGSPPRKGGPRIRCRCRGFRRLSIRFHGSVLSLVFVIATDVVLDEVFFEFSGVSFCDTSDVVTASDEAYGDCNGD